jgi:hypothetical protein
MSARRRIVAQRKKQPKQPLASAVESDDADEDMATDVTVSADVVENGSLADAL